MNAWQPVRIRTVFSAFAPLGELAGECVGSSTVTVKTKHPAVLGSQQFKYDVLVNYSLVREEKLCRPNAVRVRAQDFIPTVHAKSILKLQMLFSFCHRGWVRYCFFSVWETVEFADDILSPSHHTQTTQQVPYCLVSETPRDGFCFWQWMYEILLEDCQLSVHALPFLVIRYNYSIRFCPGHE